MNKLEEIGNRIKTLREKKGISQDELAKLVGYTSRSSVNKIELGKTNLSQSRIIKIATALNVTPAYIMGWNGTEDEIRVLSLHEKNVIKAYRNKPEMQPAVDKLLGVENTDALLEDMKNTVEGINFPIKQK